MYNVFKIHSQQKNIRMKIIQQTEYKKVTERLTYVINNKISSKKKFAEILNVAPTTVSAWTNGRILPSISALIKIAILTHTSLDWLLLGKDATKEELDEQIFNKVFKEGYNLAQRNNLPLNGSYFLGLYALVSQELEKNPQSTPEEIIKNHQKMIVQLRK